MRVLVTGAFGNIGRSTLDALLDKGHVVRCLDLRTKRNLRAARQWGGRIEMVWGDLRCREDVARAVQDQEVVIHLAFIIPKLSATGYESENHPIWAQEVNVGGTRLLLEEMQAQATPAKLLFASSFHIYGRTHDRPPPLTAQDPICPIEHYAQHKAACESMVRASTLEWAILRLAASLPISMRLDPGMFDIPLDNRMEYVHTRDVGLAFASAVTQSEVWGKLLLIGGGPACQYTYRDIAGQVLEGLGVGMLPEAAFSRVPFPTDWLDTVESQALLEYQRHTLEDYVQDMIAGLGIRRRLIAAIRPIVRWALLKQSPYYWDGRVSWFATAMQGIRMLRRPPTRVETHY